MGRSFTDTEQLWTKVCFASAEREQRAQTSVWENSGRDSISENSERNFGSERVDDFAEKGNIVRNVR